MKKDKEINIYFQYIDTFFNIIVHKCVKELQFPSRVWALK